jgi:cystathionine beta-lyase
LLIANYQTCLKIFILINLLGEEIVAGDDLYGGSDRLLSKVIPKRGIVVKLVFLSPLFFVIQLQVIFYFIKLAMCRRVNTTDLDEVVAAIGPSTKLVWLESPTNPRLQISDIRVWCLVLKSWN